MTWPAFWYASECAGKINSSDNQGDETRPGRFARPIAKGPGYLVASILGLRLSNYLACIEVQK